MKAQRERSDTARHLRETDKQIAAIPRRLRVRQNERNVCVVFFFFGDAKLGVGRLVGVYGGMAMIWGRGVLLIIFIPIIEMRMWG